MPDDHKRDVLEEGMMWMSEECEKDMNVCRKLTLFVDVANGSRWCCACGYDRVLKEILTSEADRISADLLNGLTHLPEEVEKPAQESTLHSKKNRPSNMVDSRPKPMMLAVSSGSVEVIELLALAGADVNIVDAKGSTPLSIAVSKNLLSLIEVRQDSHMWFR